MNIHFSKILYIFCTNSFFLLSITGKKTEILNLNAINDNNNNNNNDNNVKLIPNDNSNVNSNVNSNNSNVNSNVNLNVNSNMNSNVNSNVDSNTNSNIIAGATPTNNDCNILYTVLEELSVSKSHDIYKGFNSSSRCCNLPENYINCNDNNNIFEV